MTLKLLPTDRSDTSTYDCPLKANPESVARRQTGTMRILGAGARVLKLITRTAIGR